MEQNFNTLKRNYTYQRTVVTNITDQYIADSGSKWGVWEMIRESIQNMLDEADRICREHGGEMKNHYRVYKRWAIWDVEYAHFEDKGQGVDFEAIFYLGASGKRNGEFKGHKGEGEVLSFLVAAREGIEKWMFSKDWAATGKIVEQGGYNVLALDIYKANRPIEGTVWRYKLTDQITNILKNIGSYFPELSRREQQRQEREQDARDARNAKAWKKNRQDRERIIRQNSTTSTKCIMTPKQEARLYVRGVYVKPLHANFSYNLNVEINRDRTMVDEFAILDGIQAAFNSDDLTKQQCELYWKNCNNYSDRLEYRRILNIENGSKNWYMMRDAFKKIFGKKAFIPTAAVATIDAINDGWKSVDLPNSVKDTALALHLETDKTVNGYVGDVVPLKFTNLHLRLIDQLKEIGSAMGLGNYPVKGAKKSLKDANSSGFYQGGEITLFEKTLNGDRYYLLETYIHECGHGDSGASDGTREFTQWFETKLIQALTGQHDKVRSLINELISMK